MKISKSSAQQIVEEIGKLVRQNINLMDETGHIIASNDPSRIGDFHTGAYRIIQNRLAEYYITPELEAELPNVRRGINLPIEVDGEVQGVIGITGDYTEVIKYGQIVKKMAEILIRERMALDNRQLDQRVRSRFLEDWILGSGLSNPQALSERGFALGIDIRSPRRCVVASAKNREQYTGSLEGQKVLEQVEGLVSARVQEQGGIILRNAARQILLLRRQETAALEDLCRDISQTVQTRLGVSMIFGIDGQAGDVHSAYLQANRAWHTSAYSDSAITCFTSLSTELLLGDLSRGSKLEYLRKIFRGCTAEEVSHYVELLEAFFAAEGSLQKAAQRLFIHKNTMQYRLKRLAETTGLDARKPSQAPPLYLAMLIYLDLSCGEGELGF
ncbi:MAG: sugar diacid recognition domain-containing protein [Candidatus Faecousia sp.]|nr:sugar diacid recognition domain-containing protein [Candidatus Faecousia sp.]